MSGGSEDEEHLSLSRVPAVRVEDADEARDLLCRNSGPSSPGGKSAPVSEVDGEDALPPLGEDDAAVEDDPAGIADVVVEVEMDATGSASLTTESPSTTSPLPPAPGDVEPPLERPFNFE